MKDADKLKLMLLAWNYQNSNAGKNLTNKSLFEKLNLKMNN